MKRRLIIVKERKMNKIKAKDVIKYLIISILLISFYILAGKLGLSLTFLNKSVSPIWPPSGLAIAGIVLLGYRYLPSIIIGAFLVNIITTPNILISLGIATGNTLEAFLGAFLIIKYAGGKHELEKVKNIFAFFLIAIIAPLVSAIIGIASLWAGGLLETTSLGIVGLTWWIGDIVSTLLIVPLILSIYNRDSIKIKREYYLEISLAMFLLIIISTTLFIGWPIQINKTYHLVFLCIPPLIWLAWRSSLRVSIIGTTILSIISITGTVWNTSLFNINSSNASLIILQLFIIIVIILTLSVSVLSAEYRKAMESLNKIKKKK